MLNLSYLRFPCKNIRKIVLLEPESALRRTQDDVSVGVMVGLGVGVGGQHVQPPTDHEVL